MFFTPGSVLFSIVFLAASLIAGIVDVTTTVDGELCSFANAKCLWEKIVMNCNVSAKFANRFSHKMFHYTVCACLHACMQECMHAPILLCIFPGDI